jgi:hypothetical protein
VQLTEDDVLQPAARAATPQATLRAQVAQLSLTNVSVGLAEGALGAARGFGQFQMLVRPAQALAAAAAAALDDAFARGAHLTGRERDEVALAVAKAKVVAHKAAIEIGRHALDGALPEPAAYA